MAYQAKQIADVILGLSNPEVGDIMSNLKLQKLLYYAQGFNLAVHGEPLFNEEIYAWQYGPVVPEVYHNFKSFGSAAIAVPKDVDASFMKANELELLKEVYDVYGQFSALRLMNMTHEERPWKTTHLDQIIPKAVMKDFFVTLTQK